MQSSTALALRIFVGVLVIVALIAGSWLWLKNRADDRADTNRDTGATNRALIVTERRALRTTQERQSRLLMCLVEAKDPQSCLTRVRGATGPGGQQGRRGATGARGLAGVGERGPRGARGPAGRDGEDGAPGKPGKPGAKGEPGLDGADGLPAPVAAPPPSATPVAPQIPCGLQPVEYGYRCEGEPIPDQPAGP
jgi:hypothetical protein